jgi:hypothetical protein
METLAGPQTTLLIVERPGALFQHTKLIRRVSSWAMRAKNSMTRKR